MWLGLYEKRTIKNWNKKRCRTSLPSNRNVAFITLIHSTHDCVCACVILIYIRKAQFLSTAVFSLLRLLLILLLFLIFFAVCPLPSSFSFIRCFIFWMNRFEHICIVVHLACNIFWIWIWVKRNRRFPEPNGTWMLLFVCFSNSSKYSSKYNRLDRKCISMYLPIKYTFSLYTLRTNTFFVVCFP